MLKTSSTEQLDPFAFAGRNGEITTDGAVDRAGARPRTIVGNASPTGTVPAGSLTAEVTMPDTHMTSTSALFTEAPDTGPIPAVPLAALANRYLDRKRAFERGKDHADEQVSEFTDAQEDLLEDMRQTPAVTLDDISTKLEVIRCEVWDRVGGAAEQLDSVDLLVLTLTDDFRRVAASLRAPSPTQPDEPNLGELHSQWQALRRERQRLLEVYYELRNNRAPASGPCPTAGVQGANGSLHSEAAIDEEIDARLKPWSSAETVAQLERHRALLKAELVDYKTARAAWFDQTGMTAAWAEVETYDEKIALTEDELRAAPVRSINDLAMLFDLMVATDLERMLASAMVYPEASDFPRSLVEKAPNLAWLMIALWKQLPGFEFSIIKEGYDKHGFNYDTVLTAIEDVWNADEEEDATEIADAAE